MCGTCQETLPYPAPLSCRHMAFKGREEKDLKKKKKHMHLNGLHVEMAPPSWSMGNNQTHGPSIIMKEASICRKHMDIK